MVSATYLVTSIALSLAVACQAQGQAQAPAAAVASTKPVGLLVEKKGDQPRLSLNALKEELGYAARDLFAAMTSLHRNAGLLQQRLGGVTGNTICCLHTDFGRLQVLAADVQQHLASLLQALLDNQPPFKKAKRQAMETALKTARETLAQAKQVVQSLKTTTVQQAASAVPAAVATLTALHKTLLADELMGNV